MRAHVAAYDFNLQVMALSDISKSLHVNSTEVGLFGFVVDFAELFFTVFFGWFMDKHSRQLAWIIALASLKLGVVDADQGDGASRRDISWVSAMWRVLAGFYHECLVRIEAYGPLGAGNRFHGTRLWHRAKVSWFADSGYDVAWGSGRLQRYPLVR
jgi:MFS family permease